MKARQLISNASYGPEELKVLFAAFDQAWAAVEADVGAEPSAVEAARLKLANIILGLAGQGRRDIAWLKATALRLLAGGGAR